MDPDFSNLLGKRNLVRIIEGFKKSGDKLQCLTGEGKSVLVRIIGSFEKPRVQEIGILLYVEFTQLKHKPGVWPGVPEPSFSFFISL